MPERIHEDKISSIKSLYISGFHVKEIAHEMQVSYATVWNYTKLLDIINPKTGHPFASKTEYQDYRAKERRRKTGQPCNSYKEYQKYRDNEKKVMSRNRKIAALITERMQELGKKQAQLADELNVTRSVVCKYVNGTCIPRQVLSRKLCASLQIPYEQWECMMQEE